VRQWADLLPELLPATEVSPGVELLERLHGLCGGESPTAPPTRPVRRTVEHEAQKTLRPLQLDSTVPVETSLKEVFIAPLDGFPATPNQVRAAPCLRTTPFSDEEIDREIDLLSQT